jgi:DNA (cytosine-5)-methyltransferase 1
MGYHRAGFEVVGVDIKPQPHFPFEFHQADVMTYRLEGFDAIHASPPCQKYGKTKHLAVDHPQLIEAIRERLIGTGGPYIIENVPGAPLFQPIMLTGAQFGMRIHRDRLFECNFHVPFELSPTSPSAVKMGRPIVEGDVIQPVGHFSNVAYARREMGIDWMNRAELAQAIPPAYTEYIGKWLLQVLL